MLSIPQDANANILHRGFPAQRLVGMDIVIGMLPGQEALIEGGDLQMEIHHLIELLSVRPLGPLHMAIEFRGPGWQDEEPDPLFLTAGLVPLGPPGSEGEPSGTQGGYSGFRPATS